MEMASHDPGLVSLRDVGLQTANWCMGAHVSDLLKIKQVCLQVSQIVQLKKMFPARLRLEIAGRLLIVAKSHVPKAGRT